MSWMQWTVYVLGLLSIPGSMALYLKTRSMRAISLYAAGTLVILATFAEIAPVPWTVGAGVLLAVLLVVAIKLEQMADHVRRKREQEQEELR